MDPTVQSGADSMSREWTVDAPAASMQFMVDQLMAEILGCVAVCVVRSRERRVLAYRSQFEALPAEAMGEAVYHLAGSAIEATHNLGGRSWFGDVEDGLTVTEAAVVHYRLIGPDHALVVVTDRPVEQSQLDTNRRILAAYEPVLLDLL